MHSKKMELVTVTSSEMIKPLSSPTLPQETLKLSLIDQLCPLSYSPAILFYNTKTFDQNEISTISAELKRSLSRILDHFRPVTGTVRDHTYIECNEDGGVLFSEASVDRPMSEVLRNMGKEMKVLNGLVPYTPLVMQPDSSVPLLGARVTYFSGGIAIGICSLHTSMDGSSMHFFLHSWAETMRGRFDQLTLPDFTTGPTLYPQPAYPPEPPLLDLPTISMLLVMFFFCEDTDNTATRKFVFKNQEIEKLKIQAKSNEVPNPTRYEALAGFIWKQIMEASRIVAGSAVPKPSVATHAVNIRRRLDPPLGNHHVGNFQNAAVITCMDGRNELPELVRRTNAMMRTKNARAFKEMQGEKFYEVMSETASKALEEMGAVDMGEVDFVAFTSWCNMGFYELDFGWGKPYWVGVCGEGEAHSGVGNIVFLVESSSKDGIEVTILLEEQKMAVLENDPEFIKFCDVSEE